MAFAGVNNFKIIVGGDFNQREINYHENSAKAMDTITCAACPGAGHDSAERADPPKCHPDTRKRVIEEIMKWVNMPDSENRIMWLNGAAGIGKSAIAQTIAEALKNTLISSFFFSRTSTSTGRDDGTRVIPTIVYHLAIRMPQARSLILEEVMRDPAIFQHSMEEQLKSLVTDPIMHLKMNGDLLTPCLVIIDGLDECNSNDVQSRIIKAIADIAVLQPLQLRFLIASRPECEIQKTFDLPLVNNISTRLTLDQKYHPDQDIETYLLDAFNTIKQTHALAYELSGTPRWPTWYDLWRLVDKSSGQFIYASIVVKFISDDNHDTREALGVIIDETLKHTLEENPFAQLDALYNHILSSAVFKTKGGYDAIMAILKVIALTKATQIDMKYLAAFLGVKESDMKLQMLHLHSIIYIPTKADHFYSIRFHHASVRDFLLDPSRSGKFFINFVKGNIFMAQHCHATILHMLFEDSPVKSAFDRYPILDYARQYYFHHMRCSDFDVQLLNEFCQLEDMELFLSYMFSEMKGDEMMSVLKDVFDFDFSKESFAVPKAMMVEDISICISIMDEFILKNFAVTEDTYIHAIKDIVPEREKHVYYSTPGTLGMSCSTAAIMESPLRGSHIYLSEKKSLFLIRRILEQWYKIFSSERNIMNNPSNSHNFNDFTVFGIGLYSCSPIMEYLFHRIKPSLVKYSHELEWFSLSRIEKVLKRLDSIEENNNDPNQNNEMEDSVEDESDRDSEDEYSNDTEDVSDAESEDEYGNDTEDVSDAESEDEYGNDTEEVSDAESEDESGKDMEDMSDEESELESDKDTKDESHEDAEGVPDKDTEDDSHENAEYKSDKDVEDESHEDAIKESTDNHIHSNAWLPVDDMGCNESWAEIFTNPSRETDDRVAYKADFNDINNVNPWIDHIGEALYFTTANESIQQLLPEHSNHWNDDGEGDKIGVKRQRKETDVEERSPRRSKLSSSGCTDTTTHM